MSATSSMAPTVATRSSRDEEDIIEIDANDGAAKRGAPSLGGSDLGELIKAWFDDCKSGSASRISKDQQRMAMASIEFEWRAVLLDQRIVFATDIDISEVKPNEVKFAEDELRRAMDSVKEGTRFLRELDDACQATDDDQHASLQALFHAPDSRLSLVVVVLLLAYYCPPHIRLCVNGGKLQDQNASLRRLWQEYDVCCGKLKSILSAHIVHTIVAHSSVKDMMMFLQTLEGALVEAGQVNAIEDRSIVNDVCESLLLDFDQGDSLIKDSLTHVLWTHGARAATTRFGESMVHGGVLDVVWGVLIQSVGRLSSARLQLAYVQNLEGAMVRWLRRVVWNEAVATAALEGQTSGENSCEGNDVTTHHPSTSRDQWFYCRVMKTLNLCVESFVRVGRGDDEALEMGAGGVSVAGRWIRLRSPQENVLLNESDQDRLNHYILCLVFKVLATVVPVACTPALAKATRRGVSLWTAGMTAHRQIQTAPRLHGMTLPRTSLVPLHYVLSYAERQRSSQRMFERAIGSKDTLFESLGMNRRALLYGTWHPVGLLAMLDAVLPRYAMQKTWTWTGPQGQPANRTGPSTRPPMQRRCPFDGQQLEADADEIEDQIGLAWPRVFSLGFSLAAIMPVISACVQSITDVTNNTVTMDEQMMMQNQQVKNDIVERSGAKLDQTASEKKERDAQDGTEATHEWILGTSLDVIYRLIAATQPQDDVMGDIGKLALDVNTGELVCSVHCKRSPRPNPATTDASTSTSTSTSIADREASTTTSANGHWWTSLVPHALPRDEAPLIVFLTSIHRYALVCEHETRRRHCHQFLRWFMAQLSSGLQWQLLAYFIMPRSLTDTNNSGQAQQFESVQCLYLLLLKDVMDATLHRARSNETARAHGVFGCPAVLQFVMDVLHPFAEDHVTVEKQLEVLRAALNVLHHISIVHAAYIRENVSHMANDGASVQGLVTKQGRREVKTLLRDVGKHIQELVRKADEESKKASEAAEGNGQEIFSNQLLMTQMLLDTVQRTFANLRL